MPWFKVDDNLAVHSKTVAAGNAAMGLWVRAGSWSMQQLSDGFIPDHIIGTLGTRPQAERLVAAGLWDRLPTGYAFHEWDHRQPSRAQVEADREAATERQRKAREAAKAKREKESKQ